MKKLGTYSFDNATLNHMAKDKPVRDEIHNNFYKEYSARYAQRSMEEIKDKKTMRVCIKPETEVKVKAFTSANGYKIAEFVDIAIRNEISRRKRNDR